MKKIKMSNMFQTGLVYNYSKDEDLTIIIDEPMPEGVTIKVEKGENKIANLIIEGNIAKKANISSEGNITVRGKVENARIAVTKKGNITVDGAVTGDTIVKTKSGNITVDGAVTGDAIVKTKSGNIIAKGAIEKTALKAELGKITINDKVIQDAKPTQLGGAFNFSTFDRAFGANINDNVKQAAESGKLKVNYIPSVGNLHIGNNYDGGTWVNGRCVSTPQTQQGATGRGGSTHGANHHPEHHFPYDVFGPSFPFNSNPPEVIIHRAGNINVGDTHTGCTRNEEATTQGGARSRTQRPTAQATALPSESRPHRAGKETIVETIHDPSVSQPNIQSARR